MKKGYRVAIKLEEVGAGGVITVAVKSAKVAYSSGDNVTVQAQDGTIYEINAGERNGDGTYTVA